MAIESKKLWLQHEPSTFSYVARNDASVDWALNTRKRLGLNHCKVIVLIGSGVIEPFTIAALPQALDADITAVEIDPQLVQISGDIKTGKAIPWSKIAQASQHPGKTNTHIINRVNLARGLQRLEKLGSKENLGQGFNLDQLHVAKKVSERVRFVNQDALSAMRRIKDVDIIGDFFVQLNINKNPNPESGLNYTKQLVEMASQALAVGGLYIIGDSGKNLPITLSHIAKLLHAKLNVSSLTHVINQDGAFSSSWYLAISKMETVCSEKVISDTRNTIAGISKSKGIEVVEEKIAISDLETLVSTRLLLAYLGNGDKGTVWSTKADLEQGISKLAPSPHEEFTETIVFPGKN